MISLSFRPPFGTSPAPPLVVEASVLSVTVFSLPSRRVRAVLLFSIVVSLTAGLRGRPRVAEPPHGAALRVVRRGEDDDLHAPVHDERAGIGARQQRAGVRVAGGGHPVDENPAPAAVAQHDGVTGTPRPPG